VAGNRMGYLRPSAIERGFGRGLTFLLRIGLIRGHFYVLEVRGRKSGRTISLPVDPLDIAGRRYLVAARGETNWVRNARAAGEVALVRALRRRRYRVREIAPDLRSPILKAYLDRFAVEVQRFFPVPKGSPVDAFADLAARYPVFELVPLDAAVPIGRTKEDDRRGDRRGRRLLGRVVTDARGPDRICEPVRCC
jgi:hypothetical protein